MRSFVQDYAMQKAGLMPGPLNPLNPPLDQPAGRRSLKFEVHGVPAQQGSKRAFQHRTTKRVVIVDDNPAALRSWRAEVVAAAKRALDGGPPLQGPVSLSVTFRFPRPAGHFGTGRNAGQLRESAPLYKESAPDVEKLLRAVCDALQAAEVVPLDARIAQLRNVSRIYGAPGALIYLEELS